MKFHSRPGPWPAAEVRAAAAALVAAFADGRLDDYFAAFAADATFLFHTTPQRLTSVEEYRRLWQSWEAEDGLRILGCSYTQPLVQVLGDTAVFSHHVETQVATRAGEETLRERETIVFSRRGTNHWLAVHEHLSAAAED
ncbi:nuclear transport factor 2 family protein [Kitasatospora aureofaciens]|uniref:nuclear transport factor 2 family protein n=1 Tax=Kitasatospora aureofaciens TaxID=1894 RepID=UPI001C47BAD7|nr:nuclear transport factor 2 family protein [Kitasatospora aureofaciens]MBV6703322.1 nuclear transport factor 2 family protein [Kitasatospora aureofaciens]